MCPPVVGEFEWRIVRQLFVLHHRRFDHRPPHLVLDLNAVSNSVDCWLDSMCAEGSCGSDVPFCSMCNTQLRASLSVFHLLILSGGILLEGCIHLEALLLGSFLHFQQSFHMFFLWRCPLRLGWIVGESAPIPLLRFLGASSSVCP